jgi:hypothetical protein
MRTSRFGLTWAFADSSCVDCSSIAAGQWQNFPKLALTVANQFSISCTPSVPPRVILIVASKHASPRLLASDNIGRGGAAGSRHRGRFPATSATLSRDHRADRAGDRWPGCVQPGYGDIDAKAIWAEDWTGRGTGPRRSRRAGAAALDRVARHAAQCERQSEVKLEGRTNIRAMTMPRLAPAQE